jgi:hypothetical protein
LLSGIREYVQAWQNAWFACSRFHDLAELVQLRLLLNEKRIVMAENAHDGILLRGSG